MKNLIRLVAPPSELDLYVGIRDSKHHATRQVLMAHHPAISARYQAFLDHAAAGTLEAIGASPLTAISKELRHCYGGETKKLLALKKAIKNAQPKRQMKYCPYCGTTTHETHDHYLPGARFPEFSVHALNLFPCCFLCNSTKDDDWLDDAGLRRYIHLYLDDIPDTDFVIVDLIVSPAVAVPAAQFHLQQGIISNASWALIESHFDRLHLIDRYNENVGEEIGEMLETAANHLLDGGASAGAFLALQGNNAALNFGRNHWRAVLLCALSEHPSLDEWVAATPT
jgi:hypothetical protein